MRLMLAGNLLIFQAHAHAAWIDPMICPRNEGADYCEGFAKYSKMGLLRAGNLLISGTHARAA